MSTRYSKAVRWYYDFATFRNEAGRISDAQKFARIEQILERLGNPHIRFPSVIIAGTKGKGSTSAMLANILTSAGYRSGFFSSPHLHTFRERIRIDNQLISRERVIRETRHLQTLAKDFPEATFFEWVTALAFSYFAAEKVDIAVLEVGLGGRLDTTNVVLPLVSVITPVSLDHTDILGTTIAAIAREKAGIIKPETPVVVSPQEKSALDVIEATAKSCRAPLIYVPRSWKVESLNTNLQNQRFRAREKWKSRANIFTIPLLGRHQVLNATTVLAVIAIMRKQGFRISLRSIQAGLAKVQWNARFEILSRGPIIVVDGAHNRASSRELAAALHDLFPGSRIHLVFGSSSDKDIAGMFAELLPVIASLVLTQAHHSRVAPIETLASLAAQYPIPTIVAPTVADALRVTRMQAAPSDVICAAGSLFVAAEARAIILREQGIQVETDD